jgi:hypothetical protein
MSTTSGARIHLSVSTPRSLAVLANLLFFQLKFRTVAIIEISERNANSDFHIRATSLARLMTEMPSTTKESREQVERIMVLSPATTLLPLFEPFISVAVVDLATFRV